VKPCISVQYRVCALLGLELISAETKSELASETPAAAVASVLYRGHVTFRKQRGCSQISINIHVVFLLNSLEDRISIPLSLFIKHNRSLKVAVQGPDFWPTPFAYIICLFNKVSGVVTVVTVVAG
jgi:hypothetical protein